MITSHVKDAFSNRTRENRLLRAEIMSLMWTGRDSLLQSGQQINNKFKRL